MILDFAAARAPAYKRADSNPARARNLFRLRAAKRDTTEQVADRPEAGLQRARAFIWPG